MSDRLRVMKSRKPGDRPWKVRAGRTVLGAFPTGPDALRFVRRLIAAAQ
ncbi:MAG: hypothetical protein J0I33_07595 [Microbacterium ginsengisoli]|jgi:hypothetical protein|nr:MULTISPECIES: hypothetical protein [unclassified Microbacterium]MBN9198487.1 hypothetical protein [Microbacterium ginsengisoli]